MTSWRWSGGLSTSSDNRLTRWLPVAAWALLIFTFSTGWFSGEHTAGMLLPLLDFFFPDASPETIQTVNHVVRKCAHFCEYLVLSVLLYRALRGGGRSRVVAACASIAIAGVYSLSDEFHQIFVPGRVAALTDCLVDVSGAAAGQGLLAALGRAARRSITPGPS